MQEDFDLDVILSVVTRHNLTNNYNSIIELYSFMFETPNLTIEEYFNYYELGRKHILNLYPELNDIEFDRIDSYLKKQTQKFGSKLTISIIGEKVIKLKK